jgi:ATP-dependent helicase/nuclease subunit B
MPAVALPGTEPDGGGIRTVTVPRARLLDGAVDGVLAAHAAQLPDLDGVAVVVPAAALCSEFARRLALRHGGGLIPPRSATLRSFAASAAGDAPRTAASARELSLYAALSGKDWLGDADRWALAGELAALFDELTLASVALPQSPGQFAAALERAYRTRASRPLGLEASLVYGLWRAYEGADGAGAGASAYARDLARLADDARLPLHVLAPLPLAPLERDALERYAQRAPVTIYRPAAGGDPAEPRSLALAAAWPATLDTPLAARAAALRERVPVSPLAGRLRLVEAASAEAEARAIDLTVREWLLAGKRSIAVVVLDRVVARRARALLERAQVLVRDESGWALSTTSAASAIARLFDVVSADAYHRELLDLFKSPFLFHDLPGEARAQAVWRFERALGRANLRSGLRRMRELAARDSEAAPAAPLLERLERARQRLGRNARSLGRWLASLREAMAELALDAGLDADSAGRQIIALLEAAARDVAQDRHPLEFAEFRRWLARAFERESFRDPEVRSPVVYTSLEGTLARRYDAVLLAGADARHLPGPPPAPAFFNDGVRRELGLPAASERLARTEWLLGALLESSDAVCALWRREVDGEPNLSSPWFERLAALHALAWGDDLVERVSAARLAAARVAPPPYPLPEPTRRPAPVPPAALLPERIGVGAYGTLIACPYRFHAGVLLRLAPQDEVREEMEKRDYGERIHAALAEFHQRHPRCRELGAQAAAAQLEALSRERFRADLEADYLARAWLLRWLARIPAYIAWQCEREARGVSVSPDDLERGASCEFVTDAGARVTLAGRIDRIDRDAEGRALLIDYKTGSRAALKKKLSQPGEDVQLAGYALLAGELPAAASFVSLDEDEPAEVPLAADAGALAQRVELERARLIACLEALHAARPMPAHGAAAVCQYCELRGLCRRDYHG